MAPDAHEHRDLFARHHQRAAAAPSAGATPSATPSAPAFVTGRFATLQSRRPLPAQECTHA